MLQGGRIEIFASSIPSAGYGKLAHTMRIPAVQGPKACQGSQERGLIGFNAPVSLREEREFFQQS